MKNFLILYKYKGFIGEDQYCREYVKGENLTASEIEEWINYKASDLRVDKIDLLNIIEID